MKRFIFILLVFIGVKGLSQQRLLINGVFGEIYNVNSTNCTSPLVFQTGLDLTDIAFTPDGNLWGLGAKQNADGTVLLGLFQIDTTTPYSVTFIAGSAGLESVSLVGLNDSTLLFDNNDSLYGINVKNGQYYPIGFIGDYACGDLCWFNNDLYMSGYTQIDRIVLNSTYTAIDKVDFLQNINNGSTCFLGIGTVFLNGVESLAGFTDEDAAYLISPNDGSIKLFCSSINQSDQIYGAADMSFPTSLPVTLLNFTSTLLNKTVQLKWQTTSEINSSYFLIERSVDGVNFSGIGKVNAAGNSTALKQYSFIDQTPLSARRGVGGEAYYRLKEVDLDGKYVYSKIVTVQTPEVNALRIIGNPVQNNLQIQINNSTLSTNYLSIFDFSGRRLKTFNAQNGSQNIDVSFLSSGTYILQLITADGKVFDKPFVKR